MGEGRRLFVLLVLSVLLAVLIAPWAKRVLGPRIERAKRMQQL